jgi:DHA1 family bicyclomycin/chloramphenicol resistance-like MFS transporter
MRKNNLLIILILGSLSTISPFAIDMYLPAFEQMAIALGTEPTRIALSLSSYFVGLSVGQIFYGPLLDRFGRKPPLFAGLALFVIASFGCVLAKSVEALIAYRFLQALGGCAAQVAAVTMVRDFFPVKDAAKILSLLLLVIGVSPLCAPTLGGFVVTTVGWQAVFYVLAGIALGVMAVVALWLPEPHPPDPTFSLKLGPVFGEFRSIFGDPQFRTYGLAGAFSFSGLFVYVAASPIIFMQIFHVSAQTYGIIFASLSVGFIGGSQVNVLMHRWFPADKIFRIALKLQVATTVLFVLVASSGYCDLRVTLVFLALTLSCVGITNPNAAALALAPFSRNAGSAAALLGCMQMGMGAIGSAGVGFFGATGLVPITQIFAGTSLVAWGFLKFGLRESRK